MENIAILGSGMAGFGAAHRLHEQGMRAVMYDKQPFHGGHTASRTYAEGFTFDQGPHVSFTADKRIQSLFAGSVRGEYESLPYSPHNYWKGYWIKHPAHCNLHGLPHQLVVDVIRDFVKVSSSADSPEIRNYEDWLLASYGETFARTFPMEYTKKYHTTEARNMTTDWLGPRMYRPTLEEVLTGALTRETPNVHYVTEFRYPSREGFVAFLKGFLGESEIRLNHQVTSVDPKARELGFANGQVARFDGLVSSVPLTDLIPLVRGAPARVVEAAARLASTSCVLVNIGVDRRDLSPAHVLYFYDEDIVFTRLSFPHLMSPHNAPPGAGSIQAEVYFSKKYKPLDRAAADCAPAVIADLRKCGVLKEGDRILFTDFLVLPHAQVIFDLERAEALSTVHQYLDEVGIAYCGRYGEWAYIWTDEAFKSGEEAAQKALDRAVRSAKA